MNWLEEIAAELPAPRADERPELRRRIVAEINDHLELAFVRELHLTRDETRARENVLARFGDPRRIASKLWFEAMQEKIMSQRLLAVSSTVTTIVCLALGFFIWRLSAQSAEASRALIQETRELNQALIEKLGAMATPSAPVQTADMVHLKIRLVQNTADGPPAVGYVVQVFRAGPDRESSTILDKSDSDGLVDCGLVRFGNAQIDVGTPSGERGTTQFYVRAGRAEQIKTIICPSGKQETAQIQFTFDVPDDLRDRVKAVGIELASRPLLIDDVSWERPGFNVQVAITPDGELCDFTDDSFKRWFEVRIPDWALVKRRLIEYSPMSTRKEKIALEAGPFSIIPRCVFLSAGPAEEGSDQPALNATLIAFVNPGQQDEFSSDKVRVNLDSVWKQIRSDLADANKSGPQSAEVQAKQDSKN